MLSMLFMATVLLIASLVIGWSVHQGLRHRKTGACIRQKWMKKTADEESSVMHNQKQWVWCLILVVPMTLFLCFL